MAYDDRPHPVRVVLWTLAALALIAGIIVGGYLGGWWLKTDVANRNAHLIRHGYEVQSDFRDKVVREMQDLGDYDTQLADPSISDAVKAGVRSQRHLEIERFCLDGGKIVQWSDVTPTAKATYDHYCTLPPTQGDIP